MGGSWVGNDIAKKRWAFGINTGPSFAHARMTQATSGSLYTVPPNVKALPYGLSGIGCLIDNGTTITDPEVGLEGFSSQLTVNRARTIVAWTEKGDHFFMIMANEWLRFAFLEGWEWDESLNFLKNHLPSYMESHTKGKYKASQIQIHTAMMLDGGSHGDIIYIRIKQKPNLTSNMTLEEQKEAVKAVSEFHEAGGNKDNRSTVYGFVLP